ncbi:hypothetical protein [Craurococcus roseus]|uniref:hypothetical protein n=1 Tax=Craurococcus roseus TaxID=77585 RepID=UPI0031DCEC15
MLSRPLRRAEWGGAPIDAQSVLAADGSGGAPAWTRSPPASEGSGARIRPLEQIDRAIAEVEAVIGAAMRPFAEQLAQLTTIPGVDKPTAAAIAAEIGMGMGDSAAQRSA